MSIPVRPFSLATFAALAILGCIGQDGTGTSGGSSSGTSGSSNADAGATTTEGKACADTAAAYATAAQRCGSDYEAERKAFIRDLAGGDCDAVSIRNESELRSQCIPSFSRISCADLKNARFVPACAGQILRSR